MQVQTSTSAKPAAKQRASTPVVEDVQDRVLREVVRVMEEAQAKNHWTWSWLANESELTPSAYYAWRTGKTKGFFLKRINAALKPLGYRLYIGRLK